MIDPPEHGTGWPPGAETRKGRPALPREKRRYEPGITTTLIGQIEQSN
ncbi:MAG: hypothetical protein GY696_40550 [Gammaproteobacteria bacterium]|nr:hypothetical protein [Gammaproteobacteria bacterium]